MAPNLSVIIPTWRRPDLLRDCLASIAKYKGDVHCEVLVCDNESDGSSAAIANDFRSSVVDIQVLESQTNLGFAEACNRGVAESSAPFILLLNNDAKICSQLDDGVTYLESHPRVAVCQGPVMMSDGVHIDSVGSLLSSSGFLSHLHLGQAPVVLPDSREVFSVKGAAMWIRREALQGRPPFDEDAFAYFEESDLCWRILITGWEVWYVRELPKTTHKIGSSSTGLPPSLRQFHSFKNRFRAVLRYSDRRSAIYLVTRHLSWCAVISIALFLSGRPREGAAIVKAIVWNMSRLRTTMTERREFAKLRMVSDRALADRIGSPLSLRELRRQHVDGDRAEILAGYAPESGATPTVTR